MEGILVKGCPLCEIFTNGNLKTKLYYPKESEINEKTPFVIVECDSCNDPMVVVSDHTTTVGKELWGKVLYRSRKLFGGEVKLRLKRRSIKDHWHAHLEKYNKDEDKLPDLRGK